MKDMLKNFFCLLYATIVWLAGIALPFILYWGIKELDVWYLLPAAVAVGIIAGAVWLHARSERFKAALEVPFGFFSGA